MSRSWRIYLYHIIANSVHIFLPNAGWSYIYNRSRIAGHLRDSTPVRAHTHRHFCLAWLGRLLHHPVEGRDKGLGKPEGEDELRAGHEELEGRQHNKN